MTTRQSLIPKTGGIVNMITLLPKSSAATLTDMIASISIFGKYFPPNNAIIQPLRVIKHFFMFFNRIFRGKP